MNVNTDEGTIETELKFQIPADALTSVQRAVLTARSSTVQLRARYFDTPDRRLAQAGLALRLRQEGTRWVQTLKGCGAGALHRMEHEVEISVENARKRSHSAPALDITRHDGSAAGNALAKALRGHAQALQLTFETEVQRTSRQVRNQGAMIEVALDVGELRAGPHRQVVCEIEFELKRGTLNGLLALASTWVGRHHLWLDVRSKAERGDALARGAEAGPAATARHPALDEAMSGDMALRAILSSGIDHVLPNAADIGAGLGTLDHLHQLRVGLRRLRSALRVFGRWSVETDPTWEPRLARVFTQLGNARDLDMLAESVLPELRTADAPLAELRTIPEQCDPGSTVRSEEFTKLMLQLLGFASGQPGVADGAPERPIGALVEPTIRRLWKRLKSDAEGFEQLDDAHRHRIRKRMKRLRYSLEFMASLYPAAELKAGLKALQKTQSQLGRYNDLAVAERIFRAQIEHDAKAWFAVGWLAAQRRHRVPQVAKALERLARTHRPRRKVR
jgi:triphosphatase